MSIATLYNVIHVLRYALLAHALTNFLVLYANYVRYVFKKTVCPAPLLSHCSVDKDIIVTI